jgi:two-component system, response regulator FlrC
VTDEKRLVLVVDDDEDIRDAVRDTLTDEGYAVVTACDGLEALRWVREHAPPALVLLDWNMTPMNGPAFMEEYVKEPLSANVPVVLLTADAGVEDKAQTDGYAGFLRKPVTLKMLIATVHRHAGSPTPIRAR